MNHAQPWYQFVVNGTPLGPETAAWINSVKLEIPSDGAQILTILCDGWDPVRAIYRLLDEKVFFPGNKVVFRCGYGSPDGGFGGASAATRGLFRMKHRDPDYTTTGVPVEFVGYDGLQKFMANKQARVMRGYKTCAAAVEALVTNPKYGYNFTIGPIPAMSNLPPNTALAGHAAASWSLGKTPEKKGDRLKERGMTDLKWLKIITEAYGFMYPKIRYNAATGEEVFVWTPPATGPDSWSQTFWYRGPGNQSDLLHFKPHFDISDAPAGVEVLGWDRKKGRPIRVCIRVEEGGEPIVTWDNDVVVSEKIASEIKSGAKLRLSVLGHTEASAKLVRATKGGQTWQPEKSVLEAMTTDMIRGAPDLSVEDLVTIGKTWLHQREAAWWSCEFEMENQPGLHLVDVGQVHQFRGMAPMDEGYFIVTTLTHEWSGGKHKVSGKGQKLIEQTTPQTIVQQAMVA